MLEALIELIKQRVSWQVNAGVINSVVHIAEPHLNLYEVRENPSI